MNVDYINEFEKNLNSNMIILKAIYKEKGIDLEVYLNSNMIILKVVTFIIN